MLGMNEYTTGNDLHDGDYGTSSAALFSFLAWDLFFLGILLFFFGFGAFGVRAAFCLTDV